MEESRKVQTYEIHEVPKRVKNGVTYYTCSGKSVGCMLKSARKSDGTIWQGAAHYCSHKKIQPHRYAVNYDIEGKIVSIGIIGRCTHTSLEQAEEQLEREPNDIASTLLLYLTSSPKFTQLGHYRQTKNLRKAMECSFNGLFLDALSLISRDKKIVYEWTGYPSLSQTVDAILELLEISWMHGFYSDDEKAMLETIAGHIKQKRRLKSANRFQVEKFIATYIEPGPFDKLLNRLR